MGDSITWIYDFPNIKTRDMNPLILVNTHKRTVTKSLNFGSTAFLLQSNLVAKPRYSSTIKWSNINFLSEKLIIAMPRGH